MATPNPGEPPYDAPLVDSNGKMNLVWYQWMALIWKKIGGGSSLSTAWGSITGTLSAQADLVAAFAAKVTGNASITGATKTKITYDPKGLVTAGADLVAGDIPNIAESQVTGLTADLATLATAISGAVPTSRTISTTAPLTGGGDLSANRTLAVSTMVGDSGAGGAGGVVPAPSAGDAAAGKFLKADGTFAVPPGTGGSGTVTHTGALDAHKVVIGNGTDDVKVIATGSAGQYCRSGGSSADPAMASIAESEVTNLVSDLALKATKVLTTKGDLATFDTVENRLGVGSDGQILIADSTQTKGIKWGNVSGASGSAAASGPYLVIGTNSYVFPMHSCALPDTSVTGFAWSNQNSAATAAQTGALLISQAANGGGGLSSLTKSIGVSTSLVIAFIPTIGSLLSVNAVMGVVFYESGTGKMVSLALLTLGTNSTSSIYEIDRWSSSGTVFTSTPKRLYAPSPPVCYLKLQISGSNLIYSISGDGINYSAVLTEAKTASFTTAPDKWGYTILAGSSIDAKMLVVSWEES